MDVIVALEESKKMAKIEPNRIGEETKKSLRVRIISAIVGLAIVLPIIFVGDWVFFALAVFGTVVGTIEIVKCCKRGFRSIWIYVVSIAICIALTFWPFLMDIREGVDLSHVFNTFERIYIPIILFLVGLVSLLLVVILNPNLEFKDACSIFTLLLILSLGVQATLYVRYAPSLYLSPTTRASLDYVNGFDNFASATLLFYVAFGCFFTDIGAYFIGVFFGKHKINERISPKKTYEGFVGGILISTIISSGFAFLMSGIGHPVLEGVFDIEHWYHIVGLSLIMPIMATIGDFVFSACKRTYGIKDFGNILPGHGGVCDRLDSWFFVFMAAAIYIVIVKGTIFI